MINMGSEENEPQIKAPRVTPLEGVYTYALQGIRGCGVEGTPSRASGGRVHVCPQGIRVVWESRTVRFRSENPEGFGMMNADL